MESVVKDVMLEHLLSNNLLSCNQHGFLPGKSTVTELLECIGNWADELDSGNYVDIVYIDFQKAFDSVVHSKLLRKCEAYGFDGDLLRYLGNFLRGRRQRVKIEGVVSSWKPVLSGVPQGSVLGPLLFLIFINDMPDVFGSCICKLYADDSKLFKSFSKDLAAAPGLQRDLTSLQLWCDAWQLNINVAKCALIKMGLRRRQDVGGIYSLSGIPIPLAPTVKDLGVFISYNLCPLGIALLFVVRLVARLVSFLELFRVETLFLCAKCLFLMLDLYWNTRARFGPQINLRILITLKRYSAVIPNVLLACLTCLMLSACAYVTWNL
jgi:hypothetical protein